MHLTTLIAAPYFITASIGVNADSSPERRYPQDALQCYSSSALQSQKDGKIICPQDRNNYCIKEVTNATTRADCGTISGTYHGRDVWDVKLAQCVYRKCGNQCPSVEDDRKKVFGGNEFSSLHGRVDARVFNRSSYCCDSNLCNQGPRIREADGRCLKTLRWVMTIYFVASAFIY